MELHVNFKPTPTSTTTTTTATAIMCSVVEIKNLEEYCISYHSPESLENLDHLVKVGQRIGLIPIRQVQL